MIRSAGGAASTATSSRRDALDDLDAQRLEPEPSGDGVAGVGHGRARPWRPRAARRQRRAAVAAAGAVGRSDLGEDVVDQCVERRGTSASCPAPASRCSSSTTVDLLRNERPGAPERTRRARLDRPGCHAERGRRLGLGEPGHEPAGEHLAVALVEAAEQTEQLARLSVCDDPFADRITGRRRPRAVARGGARAGAAGCARGLRSSPRWRRCAAARSAPARRRGSGRATGSP